VLLRRLIGPLVLYDESTRPDYVEADAVVKTGLIDGLAEIQRCSVPSRIRTSSTTRFAKPFGHFDRCVGTSADTIKLRMLAQKDHPRAVAEDEEIGGLAANYDVTYIVKRENRGDRSLEVLVHERCIWRRFTSAQSGAASRCGRDVIGTGGLC
jgi:hypothetical protein